MSRTLAFGLLIASVLATPAAAQTGVASIQVDAEFPGGNIVLERIEGNDVYVHQDLRDTTGYWFYWHFRVRGAEGRTLTFHFPPSDKSPEGDKSPIGVRGPAVSDDGGRSWRWLGAEAVRDRAFTYAFPKDAADVRFCFAYPYVAANLQAFLKRHEGNSHLRVETLCKSKKGREVPLLFLGQLDGEPKYRVALTCRHHCCEMMAGYVLEGIIDEVLAETADGRWLRENVAFFIVPMVDKDGVEDGDQGKNRKPRDHNRDYVGTSIHPEVAAIRERLPAWSEGKLTFAMDMHCPAARGPSHEIVYFVGGPDKHSWSEVGKLCQILETVRTGPIRYRSKNNMPWGQGWNTDKNVTLGKPFSHFAAELPGIRAATTIEVAYANAEGDEVTDESARLLGRDLARALRRFLQTEQAGSGR